ncbi:MAG: hypothetical protein ACFCBU_11240 [Cyanophyceae cyanobacterium]
MAEIEAWDQICSGFTADLQRKKPIARIAAKISGITVFFTVSTFAIVYPPTLID